MKLDSVVLDLTLEERNLCCANILLWDRQEFYPYYDIPESKPLLKVNLLSSKPRQGFEAKVESIYSSTERVKQCFSGLEFAYPDYNSTNESVNDDLNLGFINALTSLDHGCHLKLNVACLALRTNWLRLVEKELTEQDAWIISSKYQGISSLDKDLNSAIHPCGIYNLTKEFATYIQDVWTPIVKKYSIVSSDLNPIEMLYKALDDTTFSGKDVSAFRSKFVDSSLFANHNGQYENKHYDGVALRKLLRDKSLVIGMSKHLFRELETIDISYSEYRKIVRQHFRAKQI